MICRMKLLAWCPACEALLANLDTLHNVPGVLQVGLCIDVCICCGVPDLVGLHGLHGCMRQLQSE